MPGGASGCTTLSGPNPGIMAFPIPVSPFVQKLPEDELLEPPPL